jgi:hypothetical protein
MALIVDLGVATAAKAAIVGSLLVIGLADNLTDSLSVHIYQESERLAHGQALRTTAANYVARLTVTASFVALVLLPPAKTAAFAAVTRGVFLLSGLSYLLTKARQVGAIGETFKHTGVALGVIVMAGFA